MYRFLMVTQKNSFTINKNINLCESFEPKIVILEPTAAKFEKYHDLEIFCPKMGLIGS